MKKIQLSSLLLGLGLLGGVGFGTTYIHQQANTNIKNVRLLVNNNSSKYACVINGNGQLALTNSNGQVIGYVSVGEMLTLGASSNGKTFVTVQETGIQGYLANSNIKDITSGINQSLVKMNRKGYIINVSTDVHVRANATMDSQVLADLSNNTNLTITGKQGNWIRVNVNGIKGYVFDEYIAEGSSINGGTIVVPNNTNIKTTSTSKNNKIVVNPSVIHNSNNKVNVNNTPAPVVHYENNTPVPAVHHENKTTSVAHHENNTPAPAVHHENKTTPVVHHENNTPAPAVHHKVIKTGIKVGSQKFYNIINEQMIKLTNEYRALHGLKPVKENSILTKMADWKTNECVETNTFSDYTPSGQTVFQQPQFKMYGNTPSEAKAFNENLAEAGISGGENGYFKVSTIQGFANQAFYDLIMSPAHKANILNQNSTEIGLSSKLYKNKNTLIIAQEFGTGIN